jgi:5-methylcytosine-specific restriction endonuclease McrA
MPSSKGYVRNYAQENKYKSTPEQIHARVIRNKNRAEGLKKGIVHKGDGKEIDHKVPLSKGGSAGGSNLRVVSASSNDSFKRNSKGALVSQVSTKERLVSKRERRGGNS